MPSNLWLSKNIHVVHFCVHFFLQMEQCAQFKAQLIECKEKSQWMGNHVEDIKMQLHQTQQGTL